MKSFIRYLYEYQNGKRTRNTGFVKVLEQTDTAEIQIYGRGFPVAGGRTLEIYLFYEEDGKCIGIRMGEIRGAQAAFGYKLSYTTDDVGGDGQFGRIGGMILRAGNGADAGYYGAVWDEARPVDVSRMITEEEWKLNKSGKNKKIANGGDGVLSTLSNTEDGINLGLEVKFYSNKSASEVRKLANSAREYMVGIGFHCDYFSPVENVSDTSISQFLTRFSKLET